MFRTLICALLSLASAWAMAASATLIAPADYVPDANATPAEAKALTTLRGQAYSRNVKFVRVNPAAFGSGVLTITTPDGVTREFVGALGRMTGARSSPDQAQAPELLVWTGTDNTSGATARFSSDGSFVSGRIEVDGRVFHFAGTAPRILAHEYVKQVNAPTDPEKDHGAPSPRVDAPAKSTIQRMQTQGVGDTSLNVLVVWSPAAVVSATNAGYNTTANRAQYAANMIGVINSYFNQAATTGTSHVKVNIASTVSSEFPFKDELGGPGASATAFAARDILVRKARQAPANADITFVINSVAGDDNGMGYAYASPATRASDAVVAVSFGTLQGNGYAAAHTIGHLLGASHTDGYHAYRTGPDGLIRCYFTALDTFARQITSGCGGSTPPPVVVVPSTDIAVSYFSSAYPATNPCTTFETNCVVGDGPHNNAYTMRVQAVTTESFRLADLAGQGTAEIFVAFLK